MRLLLVGAFPYPHHHGSQVYFQEQAIALRAAGAVVELLTYASGEPPGRDIDRWRALDGFRHWRAPGWSAPRSTRSGPQLSKILADGGLAIALNNALSSAAQNDAPGYDAILTHNIEATLVATALPRLRQKDAPPIVYCVHTLMENELSAYPKWLKDQKNQPLRHGLDPESGRMTQTRSRARRIIDGLGSRLDRRAARVISGWIALTHSAARVMRRHSAAPGDLIPPPIPDPLLRLDPDFCERVARNHDLPAGAFFLYSGNLDGYQELGLLAQAAQRVGAKACEGEVGPPVIAVASHDPAVLDPDRIPAPLRRIHVRGGDAEMTALLASARASVVMRRAEGGFPIKLANSLALATPPICLLGREWGLEGGLNAHVVGPLQSETSPAEALATGLQELAADPLRASLLGRGARALYEAQHRPAVAAERTLALLEKIRDQRSA